MIFFVGHGRMVVTGWTLGRFWELGTVGPRHAARVLWRAVAQCYGARVISHRAKTVVVTVHVITSVAMLVVTAALVAIQLQGSKPDQIWNLATRVLTPTAGVAFASGLVLAVGGPWGLFRFRWVIAKLEISALLAGVGLVNLAVRLDPLTVLVARSCALVALVALVAVSVAKPWGRTPRHRIHWTRRRAVSSIR